MKISILVIVSITHSVKLIGKPALQTRGVELWAFTRQGGANERYC